MKFEIRGQFAGSLVTLVWKDDWVTGDLFMVDAAFRAATRIRGQAIDIPTLETEVIEFGNFEDTGPEAPRFRFKNPLYFLFFCMNILFDNPRISTKGDIPQVEPSEPGVIY